MLYVPAKKISNVGASSWVGPILSSEDKAINTQKKTRDGISRSVAYYLGLHPVSVYLLAGKQRPNHRLNKLNNEVRYIKRLLNAMTASFQ